MPQEVKNRPSFTCLSAVRLRRYLTYCRQNAVGDLILALAFLESEMYAKYSRAFLSLEKEAKPSKLLMVNFHSRFANVKKVLKYTCNIFPEVTQTLPCMLNFKCSQKF